MVLQGGWFSPDFGITALNDVVWASNLDGVIGYEVITHTLSVGRHRINLSLPGGLGGEAYAGMYIVVGPRR